MDGDRDVLQLTDRLRHGRTIHRQGRLGRRAAFAYSQSDLCGRGSGAVIGDGDLAGIGPGGEPGDGLDGPGGIGRVGGNIRAAGGVDGKVLRVDADIGNGGGHVAVFLMEMAAAPGVLPSATEPKSTLPTVRLGVPAVAETVKVTSACAVLPLS